MDAYIYQADCYCASCAEEIKAKLTAPPEGERFDSDDYPAGPFADGGGESDVPEHCAACGGFLENPLTSEGYAYVREQMAEHDSHSSVIAEWAAFYDIDSDD